MLRFALTTSILALAAAAAPLVAQTATPTQTPGNADAGAQSAPTPDTAPSNLSGEPADIIVTAQKRAERLQEVPVAVTVLNGQALEAQGRVNLEGAANLVPSFNFLKSGTTLNQSLFLRGVGTATFSIAGEPSVSTVVDGVVFSRSGEAFEDLVDVERLEVLRGPQGTLFGKNASAGVINIITQKPTDKLEGYVEGSFFTKSEYRGRAVLNLPLSDTLRTRLTGYYSEYDGNLINLAQAQDRRVNGFRHYGFRVQAVDDLSDKVTATLIVDWHHNNDDCCAEVIGTGPLTGAGVATTSPIFAVLPTPQGDRTRQVNQDLITRTKETGWGASLQVDAELGTQTVTSITAYRRYLNTEIRDGDFLPAAYVNFNQLHDFGPQDSNTLSQEFRLTSPGHELVDYVLGAYFSRAFSERIFTRNDIVCNTTPATNPNPPIPCGAPGSGPVTMPTGTADFGSTFKNFALFGQGTVNFTQRFRAIVGLRYTIDQLNVFHKRVTPLAGPGIQPNFDQGVYDATLAGAANPVAASNGIPWRGKATNENLSGKAGLQFDVTDRTMAYATYARGYKGPAFNVFYNLTFTGTNVISPETSDAYEVGLKNTLFGGTLVFNLAGYYAKYHNFQANNPDVVAGVVVTRFTNAGDVSTRGGELDLLWRPVTDLSVSGGVAYTDAHVDQFKVAPGAPASAIIPSGTPLGFAPKWKGSLSADYRWRTGGSIDPFFGAQGSYQSSELALFSPDPVQRQLGTIQAYGLVNLTAGIVDSNDRYRLTFQVRNLFDQSFAAAITNGGPAGSYRYQIPRDADRYFGVTGRVNF